MESNQFDFKLFDTLLEPVFILRADSSIAYCNETASMICDLSVRKITRAKSFSDIMTFPEGYEQLSQLELCTDPTPYRELHFISTSQKSGKAQITIQPLTSTPEKLWIVFFRDVTLEEKLQLKYRAELEQKEGYILELQIAQGKLEDANKSLENRVAQRTSELRDLNNMMRALLDSLKQGFFMFDKDGTCLPIASQACFDTIEVNPAGRFIWDVLSVPENKVEGFKRWLGTVFSELLPFEDLAPLGPNRYEHTKGKHIQLEYYPMRNNQDQIDSIVVVATDTTHIDQARQEAEREKSFAQMIINLIKKKKEITQFIGEARKLLHDLHAELYQTSGPLDVETVFRLLHTVKGGAASFSILPMANSCHEAEDVLAKGKWEGFTAQEISALRLKYFEINENFESFLRANEQILGTATVQGIRTIEVPVDTVQSIFQRLNKISQAAHIAAELERELLCVPIGSFFEIYNEVIGQVSELTGKKVATIAITGAEIPVRSEVYGDLFTSFVHQFRNAVDHGIEAPDLREQRNKPDEGQIKVDVKLLPRGNGEILQIKISDDGGGIDPQKIRERLKKHGIQAEHETDDQVIQHIFDSQFSTRDTVTTTSGRGVGMDAILFSARRLGGTAWVESRTGEGTQLFVEVPYIREALHQISKKAS